MFIFVPIVFIAIAVAQVIPSSPSCTGECGLEFNAAWTYEYTNWNGFVLDSFYDVPSNVTGFAAGSLVKWEYADPTELVTNWTVPAGTSLARFMFMTEDPAGNVLPASAFALLPFSAAKPGEKLRTVVWAHGTIGFDVRCAASNHRNLYYGWGAPYALVQAGFAVIAPDYAGLGVPIHQGFMYTAGIAHVSDVAFSLIAAREMIGDLLLEEWAVVGHSEGGMVAWATNEQLAKEGQEALLASGTFLGAVALAPARNSVELTILGLEQAGDGASGQYGVVAIYLLQSLAGLYPDEIQISDYLTNLSLSRMSLLDQGCVFAGYELYYNLTVPEIFQSYDFLTSNVTRDWQEKYAGQGPKKLAKPMLIVQGTADEIVIPAVISDEFNQSCTQFPDSSIHYLSYTGADHDMAGSISQGTYIRWLNDLFDGAAVPPGCNTTQINPVTDAWNEFVSSYIFDDSLLG